MGRVHRGYGAKTKFKNIVGLGINTKAHIPHQYYVICVRGGGSGENSVLHTLGLFMWKSES